MKRLPKLLTVALSITFLSLLVTVGISDDTHAAAACNYSINGNTSVHSGQNLTLTLNISSSGTTGGIRNVQGNISVSGSFSYVSATALSSSFPLGFNPANGQFGQAWGAGISGSLNLFNVTVRANSVGTGTITVSLQAGDTYGAITCPASTSRTLTATTPPSANADLASLSILTHSINPGFSAGNTKYSLSVGSSVTSVTVNAKAADGGAKVSGTGNRSLNYGNNDLSVTVTAPAGNTKTYTITVNRKDDRSSDNRLKSLTPSTGSISFSASTTSYTMVVPFDVSKVNFTAIPNDSKAKVSVNTPDLVAGELHSATITVTAENGAVRTYTVSIRRGKDPDLPMSKEARLESLQPSIGILSPVFSPDKTSYAIYLPFEVTDISFDYLAIDQQYAVVLKNGPDKLKIGINEVVFEITAEDGSVKEYTVFVHRFAEVGTEESEDAASPDSSGSKEDTPCGFSTTSFLIGAAGALVVGTTGWLLYYHVVRKKLNDKIKDKRRKE